MRQWIEQLGEYGASGLAVSVAMLSSKEYWTLKPDDFTPEALGLFESVMDRIRETSSDVGGIKGAWVLEQLAYAPANLRLPTLVMLAREWPEGLNNLLAGVPYDHKAKLYRHNAVTSLVTLVAHAEQASLFHPARVERVTNVVKRHRGETK